MAQESSACVFCAIRDSKQDAQEFVLKRFAHCMVMLNKYPYNPGHLLVVPYEHKSELHIYDAAVRAELIEQASSATEILKKAFNTDGCNIGINLGKAAGAGIPEHLHIHVLPRFFGDTNFLPTLTDTKQISLDLNEIYAQLLALYVD
jgi:ATP adenylyltransferase